MIEPIQTVFEELRTDILNQFIARAEERSGKQVATLWITRTLISDVIKNMVSDTDPVTERKLVAEGRIGSFDYDDGDHSIDGSPCHTVELRFFEEVDKRRRKGTEQVWGADTEDNTLFVATKRIKTHLRKAQ